MNIKIACITAVLSLITFLAQGQVATDTIQIKYHYGSKFYYQGKLHRPNKLLTIMKSNPEAYQQMKKAIGLRAFGDIIGGVGGFLVGYSLGNSIGPRNELNKSTLIVGGVLSIISLPISLSYNKNSVKAVKMYNEGLRSSPPTDGAMIELGTNQQGLALKLTF